MADDTLGLLAELTAGITDGAVYDGLLEGRLFLIPKRDGKPRPVMAGEAIRNIAARAALPPLLHALRPQLEALGQLCTSEAGTQRVACRVQQAVEQRLHVLALDLRNAFNSIARDAILAAVPQSSPAGRLVAALYGRPGVAILAARPSLRISVENGVVQGCPLAAALFAAALATGPVARARQDMRNLGYQVTTLVSSGTLTARDPHARPLVHECWYADDGHVAAADPEALAAYGAVLEARLGEVGLQFSDKNRLLPAAELRVSGWLEKRSTLVPVIHVMGLPVGHHREVLRGEVLKAVGKIVTDVSGLEDILDPQHKVRALQVAGSWARARHLLTLAPRDTVTEDTLSALEAADLRVLRSGLGPYADQLADPSPDAVRAWRQATLPLGLGGLGIHSPIRNLDAAREAAAALVHAVEIGDPVAKSAAATTADQRRAATARATFDQLLGPAPRSDTDPVAMRHRARLLELAADRGLTTAAWLRGSASPSAGNLIADRLAASTALALRLGLRVYGDAVPLTGAPCPVSCNVRGTIDPYGAHTLGCSCCVVARHNAVRDAVYRVLTGLNGLSETTASTCGIARGGVLREVHCSPGGTPEPGVPGSHGHRPGDLAIRLPGAAERWTYVDVAIHSVRATHLASFARDGRAAARDAWDSKAQRMAAVTARGGNFVPLAAGSFGYVDSRSLAFIRKAAAAADDFDPFRVVDGALARPARVCAAISRAIVEGGAYGVLAVRDALHLRADLDTPGDAVTSADLQALVIAASAPGHATSTPSTAATAAIVTSPFTPQPAC